MRFKLAIILALLLMTSCVRPPLPDIHQAATRTDPNIVVPVFNDLTTGYFNTVLPHVPSPTRGIIYSYVGARADIEQLELSLMRIATQFFDPDVHHIRDGQMLSRQFVANILAPASNAEGNIGLNPPLGTTISFDDVDIESTIDTVIRPFTYVLEQNFVTVNDGDIELQGVAIAIAVNPHHTDVNTALGLIRHLRQPDDVILQTGRETANRLLPLLREQEGLESVPILLTLFVLEPSTSVIPGRVAQMSWVDENATSISDWQDVNEQHFLLPDAAISHFDPHLLDEYHFFVNAITTHYPHHYSIIGRAHMFNGEITTVEIQIDMQFYGVSEKISFFQIAAQFATYFSPEYDVRILITGPGRLMHGAITRPPFTDAPTVHRLSW